MKHGPLEADSGRAGIEILHLLWNQKVHYGVDKIPPLDPIMSHMNPFHTLVSYFFKTYFNIILLYTPRHVLSTTA